MKTTYKNEMERAAALEAAGEYADAAKVRAWAEQDHKTSPSTVPEKSNKYDTQAEQFLTSNGIKFRATLSNTKTPAWGNDGKHGHHYRVTLYSVCTPDRGNHDTRRLTFDFWSSISDQIKGIKTVRPYDVLACVSGDAYCPETFEDFCADYGYDSDSIKALQTFRRCSAFSKRLRAFFTAEELKQLQEIQ
jgi:hypothetical protein